MSGKLCNCNTMLELLFFVGSYSEWDVVSVSYFWNSFLVGLIKYAYSLSLF